MEELARFAGSVLKLVRRRKVGIDKAFHQVVMPKKVRALPQNLVYRAVHGFLSDYYLLKYVSKEVFGRSLDPYWMAKLWLYYRAPFEEPSLKKFRQEVRKSIPRYRDLEDLLEGINDPIKRASVELSYPEWFVRHLASLTGLDEAKRLLAGLNEEVLWIRVNTLKADPDRVVRRLRELGLDIQRDGDLEFMYRVVDYERPPSSLEPIKKGEAVIQDKASAMVVEALEPEAGDLLLDLTSAPGVKASLFYMLSGGRSRIVAMDLSGPRLMSAKDLMALYGVRDVQLVKGDAMNPPFRPLKGAKVLIDAPCTSSGAIGRDPAVKVHLEDMEWASRFSSLQRRMLLSSLERLKGFERLVFSTCSVLDWEGEAVVSGLEGLKRPKIPAAYGYMKYPFYERVARLFPHLHGTEGFFISTFQK